MPRPKMELPVEQIRDWAAARWSLAEMAAELGCSRDPIWNLMKEHGIPRLPAAARPEQNYFWKGGRTVDKRGYVRLKRPEHPFANSNGYVQEHRLVMEQALGRYLTRREVVHHVDGVRGNNKIENLRLYQSNAEHLADELTGKCPNWSEEGKRRILQAVRQPRDKRRASSQQKSENDACP